MGAFRGCESLSWVEIPSGEIGVSAFNGLKNLKEVDLGNVSIGNYAFLGCEKLFDLRMAEERNDRYWRRSI